MASNDKDEDDVEDYDNSETLNFLSGNSNLSEQLSIRINSQCSALRCFEGKLFDNDFQFAKNLKFAQNRRLAMSHVERSAELTRGGKCFKAIQCFNKALTIDEECADAYVGRGAALVFSVSFYVSLIFCFRCAGSNNFTAAISDLEKALELEPEHKNAKRYRIEVLVAHGKE